MKSIAKLREKAPYVLMRKGHAKQRKKLWKAYHGKRLKKWWSSYASWECCTIAELKDAEHVGHRMKGGHRHNHIRNAHKRMFGNRRKKMADARDRDYTNFVTISENGHDALIQEKNTTLNQLTED